MSNYTVTGSAIFDAEGQQVGHIEREGEVYFVEVENGLVSGGRYVLSVEDALTFVEWKIDGRWAAVAAGDAEAPIARAN